MFVFRSMQDAGVFKAMLEEIKAAEEDEANTTSPVFQLQDSDIKLVVCLLHCAAVELAH